MQVRTAASIAVVCHEANKAYCETLGDKTQLPWDLAPDWQRNSAIRGVEFHLQNPDATDAASHEAWMKDKLAEGWQWGEIKDAAKKLHPQIKPFDELPIEQQRKDRLFRAIVHALRE